MFVRKVKPSPIQMANWMRLDGTWNSCRYSKKMAARGKVWQNVAKNVRQNCNYCFLENFH